MSELSKYLIRPTATSTIPSLEYEKQLEAYQTAVDLLNMPSAEPQIIRCKECEHYNKFIVTLSKTGQAVWDEYCGKFRRSVTADDFCSRAERREK